MSSSNEAQKNPTIGQEEQHNPPLPLPAPSSTDATKIDMSGGSAEAKLDHLGPLVVNSDGTLSRIANWEQMTEIERKNTLRVLGKRNKERMEALQGAEGAKGGT